METKEDEKSTVEKVGSLWALGGLTPKQLTRRVYSEFWHDDLLGRAGELAYFFLLAMFPLLMFLITILGLLAEPGSEIRADLFAYVERVLPPDAAQLITRTLDEVTQASGGGKLGFGILLTLWFAANGMGAAISAINAAYHVQESRPWVKVRLLAVGLTVVISVLVVVALALVLFGERIAQWIAERTPGLGGAFVYGWSIAQWPVAIGFMVLAFAIVYYFAPDVEEQKWYWITPGSMLGVAVWLLTSYAFRLYLQYFNRYSATYGSLGAVIILLLWLYMTGLAILVGAEVNAEIEHAAAERGDQEAKAPGEKRPAA